MRECVSQMRARDMHMRRGRVRAAGRRAHLSRCTSSPRNHRRRRWRRRWHAQCEHRAGSREPSFVGTFLAILESSPGKGASPLKFARKCIWLHKKKKKKNAKSSSVVYYILLNAATGRLLRHEDRLYKMELSHLSRMIGAKVHTVYVQRQPAPATSRLLDVLVTHAIGKVWLTCG